jgi:manganese transport protein
MAHRDARDDRTVQAARDVLAGGRRGGPLRRLLPFLGPAFIASIAYVDPGNFATNIEAGAELGYTLLWVILSANLIAMLVQTLSAKLGIATGLNLAEHCRERFPRPVVITLWVLMELVAMATDLAEFVGAAVGFNLLFGIPLLVGGLLTAVATFVILALERYGFRPLEAVITGFLAIIAVSYVVELVLVRPDWPQVGRSTFLPRFGGTEGVLLSAGILGATVMPHAIFLHSALTQGRVVVRDPRQQRRLFRFEVIDVVFAMGVAGAVNAAMLIMASSTFFARGLTRVATMEDAYRTLQPLLGRAAGVVFALSLLASGLSSSTVGTTAGQVIMDGFLKRRIPVWVRRFVTLVPSLVVISLGLDPTRSLVVSQVVLSFGLPFTIIPLVVFTADRGVMGALVNRRLTTVAAGVVAGMVVGLNVYLIIRAFG